MKQQKKIQMKLDKENAEGVYSNIANIIHNQSEFVFDFARIMPGVDFARVMSRVIMTPRNAKAFLMALQDNIKKYESEHGEIELSKGTTKRIGF